MQMHSSTKILNKGNVMIKGFVSIILIAVVGVILINIGLYRFAIQTDFSHAISFESFFTGGLLSMYVLLTMFYKGLIKKAY